MTKAAITNLLFLVGFASARLQGEPVLFNATVDYIEDGVVALDVEDYPGIKLATSMLPEGTKEGDCLKVMSVVEGTSLRITLTPDKRGCETRHKAILRLQKELRSK